MKRATREWLRRLRREDMDKSEHPATDALDSDARQAAELQRLRAENAQRLDGLTEAHWHLTAAKPDPAKAIAAISRAVAPVAALKPARRKP